MKKTLLTTALALTAALSATVDARTQVDYRRQSQEAAPFKWAHRYEGNSWKTFGSKPSAAVTKAIDLVTEANVKWEGADNYSYLEMPDGTIWYTSTTIRKEVIAQEEYYTTYNYSGIEVKIYDQNFQQVGLIDSDITLPEGMEYCSAVEVGSLVTRNFFNGDNNYEVMVMLNFKPAGGYGAIPYTDVFSLRGADTAAEKLGSFPGYYISAVNASTSSWSEDYYMTFFSGEEYTDDEMLYTFDVYTKASYSSPQATVLKSFTVDMVYVMSDGENETLPIILNAHDGQAYVAVAKYEKTFFEDPFDFFNDALSPDNSYVIELYTTQGYGSNKTLELSNTTKIACETPAEPFTMRSYCLGRFRYDGDITFDFGTGTNPAYILTVNDADMRDNSESFFAIYNEAGEVMETFGHNTDALMLLSDVKGYPQQYCFVQPGDDGVYQLNMLNYPQLDVAASLPLTVSDGKDTYNLSFSLDRVPGNGSYSYAVASTQGGTTADGDTYHPVLWFDRNGILSRVDRVMGGKNVAMMSPYINANGLTPYAFNTDVKTEYMAFVLRSQDHGSAKSLYELIIVNEDGEQNFCYKFPEDATGITASLANMASTPTLWYSYRIAGDDQYYNQFVSLPLNKWEGEGTAENPYLIHTAGDFALIKNDLKAHYRIAEDIDFQGTALNGFDGVFTGSIDGAGHSVTNLVLSGAPIFDYIGVVDGTPVVIKDLTLSHVTLTDAPAVLAETAYNTILENVYVYDLNATVSGNNDFGGLVNAARFSSKLTGCAVFGDITLTEGSGAGGIVYTLSRSSIDASAFQGTISAKSEVGGIAGYIQDAAATISNCHVTASLTANHTIGGIVGESMRGTISDCLVEGSITALEAGRSYSYYTEGWVEEINVGGIVGSLARATADMETGTVTIGTPVTRNVVALESITIPEGEGLLATAHRIVGRSSINDDPAIVDEKYNPETYDWDIVWGDRTAEEGIVDNYAVYDLPAVNPATDDNLAALEGTTLEAEQIDAEFFASIGFKFNGYSAEEPWIYRSMLPSLYFESTVGAAMSFDPATVSVTEGESTYVLLLLERVDFDSITMESSDESACSINPTEIDEDGNVVCEITVTKEGTYTITATNGTLTATLTVTGTSGIANVEAENAASIAFDGTRVVAPGAITLYNVAGVAVASGRGSVATGSLAPGVYIARAGSATLKFLVK